MNYQDKLNILLEYRKDLFKRLSLKKINYYDVNNMSFHFLLQYKYRNIPKCHDYFGVLLNYYYWTIRIERNVAIERLLIKDDLGSPERLKNANEYNELRRDQMLKRLIKEFSLPIEKILIIGENLIEIHSDGLIYYGTLSVLDGLKNLTAPQISLTKNPFYLPFIYLRASYRYN